MMILYGLALMATGLMFGFFLAFKSMIEVSKRSITIEVPISGVKVPHRLVKMDAHNVQNEIIELMDDHLKSAEDGEPVTSEEFADRMATLYIKFKNLTK
jgi:hypothetical protein